MPKRISTVLTPEMQHEFDIALQQLHTLIDPVEIEQMQPHGPAAIYTSMVTTWLMIQQRLQGGESLEATVLRFLDGELSGQSKNRRVQNGTLSHSTAALSQARTRLKPEVTDHVAQRVFDSLVSICPTTLAGRRVFLVDGTTLALQPTPALKAAFPPATNQNGSGVWPMAHLVVAHEFESGCALLPELGPKFGPEALGEVALGKRLLSRLPRGSIVVADRNFGIFSMAHATVAAGHEVLSRLTKQRFKALVKRAESLPDCPQTGAKRWRLDWTPTARDRKTNPELPPDALVHVQLHEIVLSPDLTLHLVSTINSYSNVLADFYKRRVDVETDIREVKVSLRIECLTSKSVAMLRKELATSITAYNLVIQIRRLAARQIGVSPRRLSFTRTWNAVRILLLDLPLWTPVLSAADWQARFERVLRAANYRTISHRPGRSYPRKAHPKRTKSNSGTRVAKAKQSK